MSGADTIFALSSAAGKAGIAVVRVSGAGTGALVTRLSGRPVPAPRVATLRRLTKPDTGDHLDTGLVLWFPAPASFTGEDCAELHLHGGAAVVGAVLEALGRDGGARPAVPGEFTRRAFHNGKLDLTEVEGLADLIDAETEAQRRQALRQYGGALGALYKGWRGRIVRVLAHLEAGIDFSDEEDIPVKVVEATAPELATLRAEMAAHLADDRRGERLRTGLSVAIVGPPNAGKSSVLNALARREAAIVAETAGTTRDVVEVHLDLGGMPVILADTAGLHSPAAPDPVEVEGMRRARARAAEADVRLLVLDGTRPLRDAERELLDGADIILVNKQDLKSWTIPPDLRNAHPVSAKNDRGFAAIVAQLGEIARKISAASDTPLLTRARHRAAVESAATALAAAEAADLPELRAEEVRRAAIALGRVTGRVDVEDLLDVIFADFCVGK